MHKDGLLFLRSKHTDASSDKGTFSMYRNDSLKPYCSSRFFGYHYVDYSADFDIIKLILWVQVENTNALSGREINVPSV